MKPRELLTGAFMAAVAAVDSRRATAAAVRASGGFEGPVCLLALGKAARGMTAGFCDVHQGPVRGLVVCDEPGPAPAGLGVLIGDHPIPTTRSLTAGEALLETAASARPDETVVVLVSGGGSSLAEALIPGVDLDDLQRLTTALLRSGVPIQDVNSVRSALSRIKAGGLAAAVQASPTVTFAISDVIGDDPATIASGPTVERDPASRAAEVIAQLGPAAPPAMTRALDHGDAVPRRSGDRFVIVAGRAQAAAGAAEALRGAGLHVDVDEEPLFGEARDVAGHVVRSAASARATVRTGETTVTVAGSGTGGRNHEAALAAALRLADRPGTTFLAAGTDGIDGSTHAAGAVVDAQTLDDAARLDVDAAARLADNDAGGFFATVPGQLVTGRTGTNVGDVWIVLRE